MARYEPYRFSSDIPSVNNTDEIYLSVTVPGQNWSGNEHYTYTDSASVSLVGLAITKMSIDGGEYIVGGTNLSQYGSSSNGLGIYSEVKYTSSGTIQLRVYAGHKYTSSSPSIPSYNGSSHTIEARVRVLDVGEY